MTGNYKKITNLDSGEPTNHFWRGRENGIRRQETCESSLLDLLSDSGMYQLDQLQNCKLDIMMISIIDRVYPLRERELGSVYCGNHTKKLVTSLSCSNCYKFLPSKGWGWWISFNQQNIFFIYQKTRFGSTNKEEEMFDWNWNLLSRKSYKISRCNAQQILSKMFWTKLL